MKLLIHSLIFLVTFILQAQVSLGVYQDARLLVLGDNKGNAPGTIDLIATLDMRGNQFAVYYFNIKALYEYANLAGGKFHRYSVHTGWVFNKWFENIEAGIFTGVGIIHRDKELRVGGVLTYSLMGEINYKITDKLTASAHYELLYRNDLVGLYNEPNPIKPNFSIGLKYQILK